MKTGKYWSWKFSFDWIPMTLTDIVHSLKQQKSYIKLKEVKISTGTATVFLINTTIALSDPKATFSSGSQKETFQVLI